MSPRQTRKIKKPQILAYGKTGYYGDIHYPTLPCKESRRTPKPEEDYVSKSMTRSDALQEIRQTSEWRKRGFDFALVPEEFCEGEGTLRTGEGKERKSLQDPRYLLISKYGGKTARDFGKEMVEQARRMIKYVDALIDLRKKVAEMNKEHFYHNDITDLNVTYDEAKGKAFLIDFEHADREPPRMSTPNNSPANVDFDHETNLIDNNIIGVFLDKLKEIGLMIPMNKTTSRSSRSKSSSRTRITKKIHRPHSI
jgi:hypothetical protein